MTRKLELWMCALALLAAVACGKSKGGETPETTWATDETPAATEPETKPAADPPAPEETKPTGFEAAEDCKQLCTNYVACQGWSDESGTALKGPAAVDSCASLCEAPPEGTTFELEKDCLMEATSCDALTKCEDS